MARTKRVDLGTKEAQLEQALAQVKRLRAELAEERRKAQRARNDRLAKTVTKLGLDEALLGLDEAQCQQVAALGGAEQRFEALARLCAPGPAPKSSAEESGMTAVSAGTGASVEDEDRADDREQKRSGLFGR